MSTTVYDPEGVEILGNIKVGIAPAVADITAPTLAELQAGVEITCAIDTFAISGTRATTEKFVLCNTSPKIRLGRRTFDDVTLTPDIIDPQDDADTLLAACPEGGIVYLWARPGVASDDALAADQMVQVAKCRVLSRNIAEATTDDGAVFQWSIVLHPEDASNPLAKITAPAA